MDQGLWFSVSLFCLRLKSSIVSVSKKCSENLSQMWSGFLTLQFILAEIISLSVTTRPVLPGSIQVKNSSKDWKPLFRLFDETLQNSALSQEGCPISWIPRQVPTFLLWLRRWLDHCFPWSSLQWSSNWAANSPCKSIERNPNNGQLWRSGCKVAP